MIGALRELATTCVVPMTTDRLRLDNGASEAIANANPYELAFIEIEMKR